MLKTVSALPALRRLSEWISEDIHPFCKNIVSSSEAVFKSLFSLPGCSFLFRQRKIEKEMIYYANR